MLSLLLALSQFGMVNAMPPFKHWTHMTEEEYQALTGQPSSVLVIPWRPTPAPSPSGSTRPRRKPKPERAKNASACRGFIHAPAGTPHRILAYK